MLTSHKSNFDILSDNDDVLTRIRKDMNVERIQETNRVSRRFRDNHIANLSNEHLWEKFCRVANYIKQPHIHTWIECYKWCSRQEERWKPREMIEVKSHLLSSLGNSLFVTGNESLRVCEFQPSKDGKYVAIIMSGDLLLCLFRWNHLTKQLLFHRRLERIPHVNSGPYKDIIMSPNGKFMACATTDCLYINVWSVEDADKHYTLYLFNRD